MPKKMVTYRRRKFRRYRQPSMNYFKIRIEQCMNLTFPSASGEIYIAEMGEGIRTMTFNSIFSSSTFYGTIVQAFGYYKITGFALEVVPNCQNLSLTNTNTANVVGGFIFGTDVVPTYQIITAHNDSILLNPVAGMRKYVNTLGSNGYHAVKDTTNIGVLSFCSSMNGTIANSPRWAIKASFYISLKKCNI